MRRAFDGACPSADNPGVDRSPVIFDLRALDAHRRRALARATPGADFLHRAATAELVERLSAVMRRFPLAAEIGSPLPGVAEALLASGQVDRVVRIDRLVEAHPDIVGDAEALPLARGSLDLAVSVLALQWVNDLPGALAQIAAALKPDGLFMAAVAGGDTLTELRQALAEAEADITGGASPRVAPFADVRSLGALLQRAGFALPVADQDRHTARYDSALALMRDLRAMGAANPLAERERRPLRRAMLMRAAEIYAERYAQADGRVTATFDVVWLSGWTPHASQQKPLRPGSAKARLAEALGVPERATGEKTPRPSPRR
jgi:SAM-dependent methyltransferase